MESLDKRIAQRKAQAKEEGDDGRYATLTPDPVVQEQEVKWAKKNGIDPKDLSVTKGPVDPTA